MINNLVTWTNSVDISCGLHTVLSPVKLTISYANGKIIILKPGGVWKWSYSSYFYYCGNIAAKRNYWLFLGTNFIMATKFCYFSYEIRASKNCELPWICSSSGYRK